MVSFDVVSLFTAIPVDKAWDYVRKKLEDDLSLHSRTNLDIKDIISLLNFVLSNNFFVYNDTIYKQIHGCAMGSPVSPVVANLCMEEIEKTAINTSTVSPKFWKRYVDDSFCIIKSDAVASFHDSLNSIDQHISFTIEHESNGQLPFLDTLISRDNGKLLVDIYRKPTHTDRYLDFHSHHDRKHKISTAETLLHRALNLPNTQVGKTRETARVCAALHSNGYPKKIAADVIRKKARPPPPTPTPEELVGRFFKWVEPTNRRNFAVLPYIKGITEPLTRILKEHDIQVTSRPVKTLQQHFPIPKFRPAEDDQDNQLLTLEVFSNVFYALANNEGINNIFVGSEDRRLLVFSNELAVNGFFETLGKMIAHSLVQGGSLSLKNDLLVLGNRGSSSCFAKGIMHRCG
ncbi:uncharacterized protein [Montipora capricornis]|uniref:uncharacterized protein n=1 Tax=Montipora capricornis TaxID=246305 RepID=UPI0035F183B8